MDTERGSEERQLLAHAERQTKALESIRTMVLWTFSAGVVAAGIWLIVLFFGTFAA